MTPEQKAEKNLRRARRYQAMTPEQRTEVNRRRWTPEQRVQKNKTNGAYYRRHRPVVRLRATLARFERLGTDPAQVAAALSAHNGRCACCDTSNPAGKGWCVDHDHVTNQVRGILCNACNLAIGKLGDTLEGVLRAVKYLQSNGPSKG